MSLAVGSRLGPYDIVAPLGSGGFGEVYKARDTRLDRTVAIKILPSADPELKARIVATVPWLAPPYSYLSASIASMRVARRVGR